LVSKKIINYKLDLIYENEEDNKNKEKQIFIKLAVPEKTSVYKLLYINEMNFAKFASPFAPKYYYSNFDNEGYYVFITESLKNGLI
jgi:hypothetical protein